MRTIVVSDLHLGAGHGADLLRIPFFQERLLETLDGADQIVLLGDVVELRDAPVRHAIAAATPFLNRLGERMAGLRVVMVPGNHDHRLAADWLDRRRTRAGGSSDALGLEQLAKPSGGPVASLARILTRAGAGEVALAYPGMWISESVYATHGHYLDVHLSVPTFERLGVGMVQRVIGGLPDGARAPDDYERILAPVYSLLYELAQSERGERTAAGNPSVRVWGTLSGGGGGALSRVRGLLLGSVALPGAVAVANRLGLGRFSADISLSEISRASVVAMRDLVQSLRLEADHVIFGHTHRRGPLPGDGEWRAGAVNLHNTGSWVWSPLLVGSSKRSPYWPGTIAVVEDDGAPEMRHLLEELDRNDIHGRVKERRKGG